MNRQRLNYDRVELSALYSIPKDYPFSDSTARYYGSMTPTLEVVAQLRHVDFEVSYAEPAERDTYANPINTHLFKPKYSGTRCYVPNSEVLAHTLRSLAVYANHARNTRLTVSVRDCGHSYTEFCGHWTLADRVMLCWKDSFLKFLKVLWLLQHGVDPRRVHQFICEVENRLKAPDAAAIEDVETACRLKGISLCEFDDVFAVQHQTSSVPWITSANLTVGGVAISVVQLPWGMTLSQEIVTALLTMNPSITKIGSAGGVGYLRNDDIELDDIFLPNGVFRERETPFENLIFTTPENKFFLKRESTGILKTVVPTIGILSNTAALRQNKEITAVDMELEGFLKALDGRRFATAHYVMDLPFKGMALGDTYYHRPYLEHFYKTFNRGKYYCFERLLTFMQS